MRYLKKKRVLVTLIIFLFIAAYARHKTDWQQNSGRLQDKELSEISGIASSTITPDVYYVHNDSGDTSRFFAIDPHGKLLKTFYFLAENQKNGVYDCEDIAVGPGAGDDKQSYIYLGDIGDNFSKRSYLTVYRFPEPKLSEKDSVVQHVTATPLRLKYPDGAKDSETLMVDPVERLLYIVSKRGDSVGVYTTPLNFKANDTITLTKRCKLHFSGLRPFKWITAGDISKDGSQVLLKSYTHVYYWRRNGNEPIWQTMQQKPASLWYEQERQGEAIAFTPDGKGYYTTSEGRNSPIYFYKAPAFPR